MSLIVRRSWRAAGAHTRCEGILNMHPELFERSAIFEKLLH